jgi:DNA-binding transcriptional MerR regulator
VKEACARYSISKQTLYVRMGSVGITGTKRANRTLFTTQDVFTLDAAHWHLSQGFGLKDLEAATRRDGVTDDDCLTVDAQTTDSVHLTIAPAQERVVRSLAEAVTEAVRVVAPPPKEDPLAPYRLLKEAATEGYILTTSTLAKVLGVSNSTLHGWNSREERLGFLLERSGVGKWVVRSPSGEAGTPIANSSSTATPLANL